MMEPATVDFLLELNRRFYTEYGQSFAATRRKVQPGVRFILDHLADSPEDTWLDLGCGSGSLAVEWLKMGRKSAYIGIDFSNALLDEAKSAISGMAEAGRISFFQANLADPNWAKVLTRNVSGVLSFAVLHHIPSTKLRLRILHQIANLLPKGGRLIHSSWQFQHSLKLMARRVDWKEVGLHSSDIEAGDTLMDWRAAIKDQPDQVGLRYVHLFDLPELTALAKATGFEVIQSFESDGKGGSLSLYQIWAKPS